MTKFIPTELSGGLGSQNTINQNFDDLATFSDNTISRDGAAPNTMQANFDFGNFRGINVADAQGTSEVPSYGQLVDYVNSKVFGNVTLNGSPIFETLTGSSLTDLKGYAEVGLTTLNEVFIVKGYSSAGDLGEGVWKCTSTTATGGSTGFDSNGVYRVLAGSNLYHEFTNVSRSYHLAQFGILTAGTDNSQELQIALDASELNNKILYTNPAIRYKLAGTVYLGDVHLGGKWFLETTIDGNYVERGTATRKNEGVILTKSAVAAGYGVSTVNIKFDELDLYFTKSGGTIKTPMLIENVDQFHGKFIKTARLTAANSGTPLDLYAGVQGVDIGSVQMAWDNGGSGGAGGFWIRNNSPDRDTKNIKIGKIFGSYSGQDEGFAIYNFGGVNAGVNNIEIGSIDLDSAGLGISVMDKDGAANYDNIFIHNINIKSEAPIVNNVFSVKTEDTAPIFGEITVNMIDYTSVTGSCYAIRNIETRSDNVYPAVQRAQIYYDSDVSAANTFAVEGRVNIDYLETDTTGNQGYQRIVNNAQNINSGVIDGAYVDLAVRGVNYIGNAVTVKGKMDGISDFNGTMICDTDAKNNEIWYQVNSLSRFGREFRFRGYVRLEGSGTVNRIINMNDTLSGSEKPVPVYINYTLDNYDSITITNPDFVNVNVTSRCPLAEYENKVFTGSSATRSTRSLTVASGW